MEIIDTATNEDGHVTITYVTSPNDHRSIDLEADKRMWDWAKKQEFKASTHCQCGRLIDSELNKAVKHCRIHGQYCKQCIEFVNRKAN